MTGDYDSLFSDRRQERTVRLGTPRGKILVLIDVRPEGLYDLKNTSTPSESKTRNSVF